MIDAPWYRRCQFEIGINFKLFPDGSKMSLRQHLFDPFFNLVWIGRQLDNPRSQLPEFQHWYVDTRLEPNTPPIFTSRCFWLGFGCRVLGLDIGVGIFYRKANEP